MDCNFNQKYDDSKIPETYDEKINEYYDENRPDGGWGWE